MSQPVATQTLHRGGGFSDEDFDDTWPPVPRLFRTWMAPLPAPWEDVFGPLRVGNVDDLVVVGQIGQSIDGRVATTTGRSHYINCPAGILTCIACGRWLTSLSSALGRPALTTRS